jgi:hypothetical protein
VRRQLVRKVEGFKRPARGTFAPEIDGALTDDLLLVDAETEEIVGAQVKLEGHDELVRALRQKFRFGMRWEIPGPRTTNERLSGIKAVTRVFGFAPPNPLRNQRWTATPTKLHREHPEIADLLAELTQPVWELFTGVAPEQAHEHRRLVEPIHRDWWFGGAPFTSGIVNKASVLPYHVDRGNVAGSWSVMLMIRQNVDGGRLHLPEYDVTLGVPHLSLTMFNGQSMWHGVTPMRLSTADGYRFSIVWYAKSMFLKCGSIEEEIRRGQVAATKRGFG